MLSYDLTGRDPNFKKTDVRFMIFKDDQLINFGEPVYAESLVLYKLVNGVAEQLTADVDWLISQSNIDNDAISDAKLQSASFGRNLINSVYVKIYNQNGQQTQVSVEYQRLKKDLEESYYPDGEGPVYSPTLMRAVIDRLSHLEDVKDPVQNNTALALANLTFLEVDLTGLSTHNYIVDEYQELNVPNGVMYLRPGYGSFYGHDILVKRTVKREKPLSNLTSDGYFDVYRVGEVESGYPLVTVALQSTGMGVVFADDGTAVLDTKSINRPVKDPATNRVLITASDIATGLVAVYEEEVALQEGTDYKVAYCNQPKTKKAHHASGVWEVIYFMSPIVGGVKVSYHAYGGEVSSLDVSKMHSSLIDILTYLSNNGYLNADDVKNLPLIKEIIYRLEVMEEFHKHYLQRSYTISIDNLSISDAETVHWYPIAFIYDNKWSGIDDGTNDIGVFRMESLVRDWVYEFQVDVNLQEKANNKLYVTRRGAVDSNSYLTPEDIDKIDDLDLIRTRIVWVGDGKASGVVLQVGIPHNKYERKTTGVKEDMFVVTNKSGGASRWRLSESSLSYIRPEDAVVTMPGRVTQWVENGTDMHSIVKFLEPEYGVPLFVGSVSMTKVLSSAATNLLPTMRDILHIKQWNIRAYEITVFDRKENKYRFAKIDVNPLPDQEIQSESLGMYYLPDLASLRVLYGDVSGVGVCSVESICGTNSYFNDRFDLISITARLK